MTTYIFNKLFVAKLSKGWDGYDCGLFSFKIINHPDYPKAKAIRLVIWRLAMWLQVTK